MSENISSIVEFDITNRKASNINLDAVDAALRENKILWIHCDINDKRFINEVAKHISLPESVNEFIHEHSKIPRLDDAEESLTIKIQAPLAPPTDKKTQQEFATLVIHLTTHVCITFSHRAIPAIQEFRNEYERSLRFGKTPCFILFMVLDEVINFYASILYGFELISDRLEFTSRSVNKQHYREVMKIKKDMIRTKRYASSIRDILMRITGRKINVISDLCRKALHDTYNHAQAVVSETDSVREILNGILDQIDNSIMHKMSETMTVLTAYATIFMPPTLISSMYGMNFPDMPEIHWKYGYYFALSLMLGSALLLYYMFKRRKWF